MSAPTSLDPRVAHLNGRLRGLAAELRAACEEVACSVPRRHCYRRDADRMIVEAAIIPELVDELIANPDEREDTHEETAWRLYEVDRTLHLLAIAEVGDADVVSSARGLRREFDRRLWELHAMFEPD